MLSKIAKVTLFCIVALSLSTQTTLSESIQPTKKVESVKVEYASDVKYVPQNFKISLRKFPYPYQAMLAISGDADHETLRKFNLMHEFLNTNDMTSMGRGVGLDISDSFFSYNGSNIPTYTDYGNVPLSYQLSYFKGTTNRVYGGQIINQYIKDGWIDTMHTFGDFSMTPGSQIPFNRTMAKSAIVALENNNSRVTVWVDHGNEYNADDFGLGRYYQQGDNPKSSYYVTDLLKQYGIKYVWPDSVDSNYGHSSIIYPLKLRDGSTVWGFWRYTSDGFVNGHVNYIWTMDDLHLQLAPNKLAYAEKNHLYVIIAQHLSANSAQNPIYGQNVTSLYYLKQQQNEGKILVARESRLLNYNVAQQYLKYHITQWHDYQYIIIDKIADPVFGSYVPTYNDLRGITFYTTDPNKTYIKIGNKTVPESLIQRNHSDGIESSIQIKWFPVDTTDYTIKNQNIK